MFQSTPPHGERLLSWLPMARSREKFQSTPPHGERPLFWVGSQCCYGRRFNPRPRMGSDALGTVCRVVLSA